LFRKGKTNKFVVHIANVTAMHGRSAIQLMRKFRFLATTLFALLSSGLTALPVAFFTSNAPVCLGSPVCFTDLSYSATPPFGYITTWVWNYGDGSPADTVHFPYNPNVCHSYPFAGIFMVTLTVTENYGNTNSYTSNANVRPNPLANFMESGNCLYQPTSFFDLSYMTGGGVIALWQWNFGDGGTSSLQNPVHFFYSAGNHNVKLRITDNYGCSDSIIKVVGIYTASDGGSVSGNATIILGQGTGTMSLIGNIGAVLNWQRSCNGGNYAIIPGTSGLASYEEVPADTGTWNYRAAVQVSACPSTYSVPATIIVTAPGAFRIWEGTIDDSWEDPANWNPAGVPAPSDNILIPCCVSVMPQVRNNGYECNTVTIQSGGTLTVPLGIEFTVNGRLELK
jgi:PKD repeat protein